jgi:hypothetical protein
VAFKEEKCVVVASYWPNKTIMEVCIELVHFEQNLTKFRFGHSLRHQMGWKRIFSATFYHARLAN